MTRTLSTGVPPTTVQGNQYTHTNSNTCLLGLKPLRIVDFIITSLSEFILIILSQKMSMINENS